MAKKKNPDYSIVINSREGGKRERDKDEASDTFVMVYFFTKQKRKI